MTLDFITQFRTEMEKYEIITDAKIIPDGILRRFHIKGDSRNSLNGWAVLFNDGVPSGAYGCWKRDISKTWCSKSKDSLTQIERQQHNARIEAAKRKYAQEKAETYTKAKEKAQQIWNKTKQANDNHLYLVKKKIKAHNIHISQDGRLIIPIRDTNNILHSLQFISDDGSKMFLKDGAINGNYFMLGPLTDRLYLCEGFATGATIFEAIGLGVVVAFNAGNLLKVALAIKKQYPDKEIVIAADNDSFTKDNPGLTKARETAKAIDAAYVYPNFSKLDTNFKPTDFNDLLILSNQGELKKQLNTFQESEIETKFPPNFKLTEQALFYIEKKEDDNGGEKEIPLFICSPLKIIALLRDTSSENWGRLLEFSDADGHKHSWGMPMQMLKGNGEELRGELLNRGLELAPSYKARNKLLEYITCSKPNSRARCVTRVGWHHEGDSRVFVLPNKTLGESQEKIVYQTEAPGTHFKTNGSLTDWKDNIAKYCSGNSRLVLAVSCAFASMLLEIAGEDSGGINYFGSSSTGKTTALRVATSVYGAPDYLSRWRATVNGLEALATVRNDCLLILDELAQVEPKEAGNAIYTLANGTGKARANQRGGTRLKNEWRILFLSSGEIDLNQHASDGGKKITAGQQVRCIDIYADAGKDLGIFETLHGFDSGDKFSSHLQEMTKQYFGTPAIDFLEQITQQANMRKLPSIIKELRERFVKENVAKGADGQVMRVGKRIALIASAGELATKLGLTGWSEGEAMNAAKICLNTWVENRGGTGNSERAALLAQVKGMFESHGDSRFQILESLDDLPLVRDRLGFKKKVSKENGEIVDWYYVLSNGFKEIHKGYTQSFTLDTLKNAGWLDIKNSQANQSIYISTLGKKVRCYVFTDAMWD